MKLNQLKKLKKTSKKRLGRGYGSGKGGHTSGRGQKGQKSRGKTKILFEGTKMRKSLIKRMPFFRGKGKFNPLKPKPITINLKYLELVTGDIIDTNTLIKSGLIDKRANKVGVKILGDGELTRKLTVKVPTSKKARAKIEKVGGKVII